MNARTVLLSDPPLKDDDQVWRTSVTLNDIATFCLYPNVLLGDFGLSVPLEIARTRGVGSLLYRAPVWLHKACLNLPRWSSPDADCHIGGCHRAFPDRLVRNPLDYQVRYLLSRGDNLEPHEL